MNITQICSSNSKLQAGRKEEESYKQTADCRAKLAALTRKLSSLFILPRGPFLASVARGWAPDPPVGPDVSGRPWLVDWVLAALAVILCNRLGDANIHVIA